MSVLRNIVAAMVMAGCFAAMPAHAQEVDPLIEGAKLCTRHLPRYERQYGIPTHLLSAIATTESGRYHQGLHISIPWPWTVNAEGKGYFFDTKAQAIAAVQKLRNRGVQSIDVGCMQVNLYHHAQAFTSLEQAFDPENNIAYAASFLRTLYEEDNSWKHAAASYHSKTPELGRQYVGLVYNSWYTIIDKLRAARMNVPDSSLSGLQEMRQPDSGITRIAASAVQAPVGKTAKPKWIRLADGSNKIIAYQSPHMNTVKVSGSASGSNADTTQARNENGIMIISPTAKSSVIPTQAAPAKPAETMVIAQATKPVAPTLPVAPSITPVDAVMATPAQTPDPNAGAADGHRPVNLTIPKKSGPNFIFND